MAQNIVANPEFMEGHQQAMMGGVQMADGGPKTAGGQFAVSWHGGQCSNMALALVKKYPLVGGGDCCAEFGIKIEGTPCAPAPFAATFSAT